MSQLPTELIKIIADYSISIIKNNYYLIVCKYVNVNKNKLIFYTAPKKYCIGDIELFIKNKLPKTHNKLRLKKTHIYLIKQQLNKNTNDYYIFHNDHEYIKTIKFDSTKNKFRDSHLGDIIVYSSYMKRGKSIVNL